MNKLEMCFYLWKRLLSAQGSFLFYQGEFWYHLSKGWHDMNYKFYWGDAVPVQIQLHPDDYDALVERLNQAPEKNKALEKLMKENKLWN